MRVNAARRNPSAKTMVGLGPWFTVGSQVLLPETMVQSTLTQNADAAIPVHATPLTLWKARMMTLPGFAATQRAVDVLSAPRAQVLACLERGEQPSPSSCDAEAGALAAAIQFLTDLGLVRGLEGAQGGDSSFTEPLALTAKGLRAALLVRDIGPAPFVEENPAEH